MDRESLRVLLAQGESVERIGKRFGKHPSTVSYWMAKHGLQAVHWGKHAAKGGLPRGRLEELVARGLTLAEIAVEVDRSSATVRHWLRRYGLRTRNKVGPRVGALARQSRAAGLIGITFDCIHHGETEFVLEGRGYYRCRRCRAERTARHRRRLKRVLVSEAGG